MLFWSIGLVVLIGNTIFPHCVHAHLFAYYQFSIHNFPARQFRVGFTPCASDFRDGVLHFCPDSHHWMRDTENVHARQPLAVTEAKHVESGRVSAILVGVFDLFLDGGVKPATVAG